MHRLLKQQLKDLDINKNESCLENKHFKKLLKSISFSYDSYDNKLNRLYYEQNTSKTKLLERVFEEATEGIIIQDAHKNIIKVNDSMENILGISKEELLNKDAQYLAKMIHKKTKKDISFAMEKDGSWQGEIEIVTPHAKTVYAWLSMDTILDHTNQIQNVILRITDISPILHSRNKMKYLASYDTLTDLPNRALLFKKLKQSVSAMERKNSSGMLLFIDIDHFKKINDNYGHQVGDKVLQMLAQRITSACREEDTLGRLSGDEFLLIAEDVKDHHSIHRVLQKIQSTFLTPYEISNLSLHITASIGIALYPKDGHTPEELINAADQAMYSIKENGRNNYAFYSKHMSDIATEYFFIHNALKNAIHKRDFRLVYQPQYSLADNSITGIEVLLRCTNESIKHIPIDRLIAIAEETGMIHNISTIVLNMACTQLYLWDLRGLKVPPLAINLSRKELHEKSLLLTIHNALNRYKLNPNDIELEITESAFLHESTTVKDNISRLQRLGHAFALDDYGTGFSSLSNIKTFHFDKLKIDKVFIDNLTWEKNDQVIVSATITMAKKLGLKVIAEGVETHEQEAILKHYGCDIIQGYLYSKPLEKELLEQLLVSS